MIDKNGENKLEKTIDNVDYDQTIKETKDMLNECKESVSNQGLNKEMVQQNQAKRLIFLKDSALKIKALLKAGSKDLCTKHLEIRPDDFKKKYIKPCTKKMANDIKQMQKETKDAFNKQTLNTKDIERANANLEALHTMKNVFEKQIDDDELCEEIKVDQAIDECKQTAIQRVDELSKEIQNTQITKDDVGDFMKQCAENLINLEYLSEHINYQTSINENQSDKNINNENELNRHIQMQ